MAKTQFSIKSGNKLLLHGSVAINLILVSCLLIWNGKQADQISWTRLAAEEAEAVASISCSGHGRAFLDGSIVNAGQPACECNACYTGPDCSEPVPNCTVDADSGDPMFLEPFWLRHAASSSILLPGWHRMSYEFNDGSLVSEELKRQLIELHAHVGNANTQGRYVVFGAGATQLLNAAVHALSTTADHPSKVVASVPYYPVYKEQTELFSSKDYEFKGDVQSWRNNTELAGNLIEFVTSPNNPDGRLKKAVLKGASAKAIHDLAYYWPHFTAIPSPADEDLMIFTLSKLTGHAGSRFGWALVKDEAVYQRMLNYLSLNTYGVPRETQLRVLKLIKVVLEGQGKEMFDFGFQTMRNRWKRLSKIISMSKRFSLHDIDHLYCTFSNKVKGPSPAFGWLKCERYEDKDCSQVLKTANLVGRQGTLFGAHGNYVRLSLVKSQDDFDLMIKRMEKLVEDEVAQIEQIDEEGSGKINSSFRVHPHLSLGGLDIISAIIGGVTDLSFDALGYSWQFANCILTAGYLLTVRRVMDKVKQATKSGSLNEISMALLNNLLSLPFGVVLIILFDELEYVMNVEVIREPMFWIAATASGLLGLAITFTSVWFLHQTGPTTYSLIGSLNKIPISLAGLVLFIVPLNLPNLFSILFGLFAGVFFAKAKMS